MTTSKMTKLSKKNTNEPFWGVEVLGEFVGFVSTFKNTRSTTHPFRAFGAEYCDEMGGIVFGDFLGHFDTQVDAGLAVMRAMK